MAQPSTIHSVTTADFAADVETPGIAGSYTLAIEVTGAGLQLSVKGSDGIKRQLQVSGGVIQFIAA